jgi:hypothetical protein
VLKRKTTIYSNSNEPNATKEDSQSDNFQTFSQFIQSTTELNNLIDKKNNENSNENNSYALIGLHTCGNLSNSIINLYLDKYTVNESEDKNRISPRLLCNIACCYDSLDEKYSFDDENLYCLNDTNTKIDNCSKFPMSCYLNNKKYYLNFNTRRLACHSLESSLNELDSYKEVIRIL